MFVDFGPFQKGILVDQRLKGLMGDEMILATILLSTAGRTRRGSDR